jgi:hypothetical protein
MKINFLRFFFPETGIRFQFYGINQKITLKAIKLFELLGLRNWNKHTHTHTYT